ncbi:efflux RND transporter periplasmic adaptor subunit [Mucilaginibacter psychrotolerans]|uniref:Efflux RND transporter periplasmic adaptor subunit n=1 Tax=Mucilaginibacter psychrotolerans TaxID=1524096 RepID=A0A4Y8SF54_9SPHI|nr:efflux RND transporter periplasmic adaptor subunit [Mucilaginibacter psychrotolerans]TFF37074.1 efflux RND transporter periplasmic adaptor subunit [Mucilaginibacter psychrotolerans]
MNFPIHTNKALQLFTGLGLLIISSCSSNEKKEAQTGVDSAVLVTVSQPAADVKQGLTVSGQVEAGQAANISTRVMGYITSINVKVGDRVSKGQILATISNDDILAKRAQADALIAQAEAAFRNAQRDYERFTALYKQQSASAKELDNITLQYSSAKAGLEAAKQQRNEVNAMLNYTRLTAPFAGTITQKMMDAGSMANPGMPLLVIEQTGSYQVSASVPESEISLIHTGALVTVNIDAIHKVINGKISQVSQSSENSGGQYLIKINIPDNEKQGLFAGMYANVSIPVARGIKATTGDQVMVPISAILYKDQLTGLYTIGSNHTALLRWVRLGKTEGNQVEVLSGLAGNEQFILSAEGRLYNGVAVKIK